MNMLVTSAAVATATSFGGGRERDGASVTATDPIFPLIEAHKQAVKAFGKSLDVMQSLEDTLPKEKRRSDYYGDEITIVTTDDANWIEAVRTTEAASRLIDDVACQLVTVKPTSLNGISAIVNYAAEHVADGHEWPSDLQDEEAGFNRRLGYDWSFFLHRNIAEALPTFA